VDRIHVATRRSDDEWGRLNVVNGRGRHCAESQRSSSASSGGRATRAVGPQCASAVVKGIKRLRTSDFVKATRQAKVFSKDVAKQEELVQKRCVLCPSTTERGGGHSRG
jgi:hypothetical protein